MLGLVINAGSSSVKARLIDTDTESTLYEARAENLNTHSAIFIKKIPMEESEAIYCLNHGQAIDKVIKNLTKQKIIPSLEELDFVAHRIVHGGQYFSAPTVINDEVLEKISKCNDLAPLHNPVGIEGVETVMEIHPEIPQIAVFDTAFNQTIPEVYSRYAISNELYKKGVRKWGFHGIAHAYSLRTLKNMGVEDKETILMQLGQGASVCAAKNGKSCYNSMGLTPLQGLIMGTRSGSIDPTIIQFLIENCGYSVDEATDELNKNAGLKGLTGSNHMLDIQNGAQEGNKDCILALEMFCTSVVEHMLAGALAIGGKDKVRQLVFSGGIGENSDVVRAKVLEKLSLMLDGISLDEKANRENAQIISTPDSRITVYVIKVNEELEMALEAEKLLKSND